MHRPLHVTLSTCLLASALGACSASSSLQGETAETEEALATSNLETCDDATSYAVLRFTSGGRAPVCTPVVGQGGRWVSTTRPGACVPLADAPVGTRSGVLCSYTWEPSTSSRPASPDVAALDALANVVTVALGVGAGGGTTCNQTSDLPLVALQDLADVKCELPDPGLNPPRQCDVCGVPMWPGIVGRSLYFYETAPLRTIVVGTSNGSQKVMAFGSTASAPSLAGAPSPSSRPRRTFVQIPLPTLPRGVSYVSGSARGYAYTTAP